MTDLALTIERSCLITPPRCRTPRSGTIVVAVRVSLQDATDESAPVLAVITTGMSDQSGTATETYRSFGGRCYHRPDLRDAGDEPTGIAGYLACRIMTRTHHVYHKAEDEARALVSAQAQQVAKDFLLVEGELFSACEEPAWHFDRGYVAKATVTIAPNEGEREVFRLDEEATVREIAGSGRRELPVCATVDLRRPDLLRREMKEARVARLRLMELVGAAGARDVSCDLHAALRSAIEEYRAEVYPADATAERLQVILGELEWLRTLRPRQALTNVARAA